jgi:hypothetical protein
VTAPEALRDWLEYWRASGRSFAEAWTFSLHRACAGSADADWWIEWFEATRPTWERAYSGAPPTEGDRALLVLAESATGDRRDAYDDDSPICERKGCEQPVVGRGSSARYCSPECNKLANTERERLAWRAG